MFFVFKDALLPNLSIIILWENPGGCLHSAYELRTAEIELYLEAIWCMFLECFGIRYFPFAKLLSTPLYSSEYKFQFQLISS